MTEKEICQAYYEYHIAEGTLKEVSYTISAKAETPEEAYELFTKIKKEVEPSV